MTNFKDSLFALSDEFAICVFGDNQVGKTSLICRYVHHQFITDLEPSVEELYIKGIQKGNIYEEISILDTTEHHDFYSSSRKKLIANSGAFIFVYAINDRSSFELIEDLYERIRSLRQDLPPIALAGLKADLEDERQVDTDEGEELARRINAVNFKECSAKTGYCVNCVFAPIIDDLVTAKANKTKTLSVSDINSQLTFRDVLSHSPSMNELTDLEIQSSPILPKKATINHIDGNLDKTLTEPEISTRDMKSDQATTPMNDVTPHYTTLPSKSESTRSDTVSSKNATPGAIPAAKKRSMTQTQTPSKKEESGCCIIM